MRIQRALGLLIVAGMGLAASPAFAQKPESVQKQDPIEALAGNWDHRCSDKGCLMFMDVLIGDPDHPADPAHPEYITMGVAINRSDRRPAYFVFDFPPDADRGQGAFIAFAHNGVDAKTNRVSSQVEATARLNFVSCDETSCTARILSGIISPQGNDPQVDLLDRFLHANHVLFLFTRKGVPYRAIQALFPFQRDYQALMSDELKAKPQ